MESESAPEFCTVTGPAGAGAGQQRFPVAVTPLADAVS